MSDSIPHQPSASEASDWEEAAKRLLRVELARKGLNQIDLAQRLAASGCGASISSIRSKFSRGTFTAAFLLQCLDAIGCRNIEIQAPRERR